MLPSQTLTDALDEGQHCCSNGESGHVTERDTKGAYLQSRSAGPRAVSGSCADVDGLPRCEQVIGAEHEEVADAAIGPADGERSGLIGCPGELSSVR